MRAGRPHIAFSACAPGRVWPLLLAILLAAGCARLTRNQPTVTTSTQTPAASAVSRDDAGAKRLGPSLSRTIGSSLFVENRGQWDNRARFMMARGAMRAWFTSEGVVYDLSGGEGGHILRQRFEGADASRPIGSAPTGVERGYIHGRDRERWRSAPEFAELRYEEIRPGVSARFYESEGALKYDLLVAPGGDPATIGFRYDGADAVAVDAAGGLRVETSAGLLREERPVGYQIVDGARHPVSCRFVLGGDRRIGFELGDYDRALPLVIDPKVLYSSYLGGDSTDADDVGQGITLDAVGNIYVTGTTRSYAFPTTPGAYNRKLDTLRGQFWSDIFVIKLDATGTSLLYGTYIGGQGADSAAGIRVGSNRITIAGSTQSSDFPVTARAYDRVFGGTEEGFVLALDPDQSPGAALLWSTYLGGSDVDHIEDMVTDATGTVFVTGWTRSSNFPMPAAAGAIYDPSYNGGDDAFVARIDAKGEALMQSTYLGGALNDRATALALLPGGSVFVTGWTGSDDFPTLNGLATARSGPIDCFVTRVQAGGGSLVWSTYLGGGGTDRGAAIALVPFGDTAYVTGSTNSLDFPGTSDASGSWFVAKLVKPVSVTSNVTLGYSRLLGPGGGRTIQVDERGRAYVAGTAGAGFPIVGTGAVSDGGGNVDIGFVQLAATGSTLHSSVIGGSQNDTPWHGSHLTRYGDLYVTGATNSPDFVKSHAFDSVLNRSGSTTNGDAFILRFNFERRPSILAPRLVLFDTVECTGTESSRTFYVVNTGDADLIIHYNVLDTTIFKLDTPRINQTLLRIEPGKSREYTIRFVPKRIGDETFSLLIESNDSLVRPFIVELRGTRLGSFIRAQGPARDPVAIANCSSDTVTVVVSNGGNVDANMRVPRFTGGSGSAFRAISPGAAGIPPNGTRDLKIVFTPDRVGEIRDTLIVEDVCGTTDIVPLKGIGRALSLTLDSATVRFPTLAWCDTSATAVVTLLNNDTVAMQVDSIRIAGSNGPFSVVSPTIPPRGKLSVPRATAAGPGRVTVTLRYAPAAVGFHVGTLRVVVFPCSQVLTVRLEGERQPKGSIGVGALVLTFPPLVGCPGESMTGETTLEVRNLGKVPVELSGRISGAGFSIDPGDLPKNLDTGAMTTVRLRYAPADSGRHTGGLVLYYRTGACVDSIQTITLNGVRDFPAVRVGLAGIDFPELGKCDDPEIDTVITLYNLGRIQIDTPITATATAGVQILSPVFPYTGLRDSVAVRLRYRPGKVGENRDTLTFGGLRCQSPIVVPLRIVKRGAVLSFDRGELALDSLLDCLLPREEIVTLRSRGIDTFTVLGTTATAPFVVGQPSRPVLNNDDEIQIPVTLAPAPAGTYAGTLEVIVRSSGCPDLADTIRLPLSATVVSPALEISGGDFGPVPVSGSGIGKVVVRSSLPGVIRVTDLQGLAPGFRLIGSTPSLPADLDTGDSLVLDVEFTPSAAGEYQRTPVLVVSSPCAFDTTIVLSGVGVASGERAELCLGGSTGGLAGDSVDLMVTASRSGPLATAEEIYYEIRYDPRRLQLLGVEAAHPLVVLDSGARGGVLRVRGTGVTALAARQLGLRFRLLAAPEPSTTLTLDSVFFSSATLALDRCADTATVRISDKCVVTGLVLGRYANLLEDVRPNPAGEVVEITYQQLEDARAVLRIWDMNGREAMRPLDRHMPGGRYSLRVDVSGLPAGRYFYEIEAGGYRESKPMIIGR